MFISVVHAVNVAGIFMCAGIENAEDNGMEFPGGGLVGVFVTVDIGNALGQESPVGHGMGIRIRVARLVFGY